MYAVTETVSGSQRATEYVNNKLSCPFYRGRILKTVFASALF